MVMVGSIGCEFFDEALLLKVYTLNFLNIFKFFKYF